jgi:broad specificity phosphatase PhoE
MTHAPQTVTIYLTRHGRTWLNELDRVQGWSDSPLTTAGKEDAVRLGTALSDADMMIDAAYSADMVRHRETAETVLAVMGVDIPVTVTPNLREMSFGGFEGGPNRVMYDAVLAQANVDSLAGLEKRVDGESALLKLFESLEEANPVPTMPTETAREVAARVLQEFEDIVAEAGTRGHENVLVVSSGVTILVVLHALGHPFNEAIKNASVSTLVYAAGEWSVERVNDTSLIGE